MAVKCTNCGGAHPSWDCSKPTKSTAALKEVHHSNSVNMIDCAIGQQKGEGEKPLKPTVAGTQALPVDTLPKPKMGRPRTGYIKAEYNRQYMADLRTIKRLGLSVTVAQYRKSKET